MALFHGKSSYSKISNYQPPKFGSPLFWVSTEVENWHQPLWKNDSHFMENCHTAKFQITNPHKVWVSTFLSVNGNGKLVLAIMKKWENGSHFAENHCTAKFQITAPGKSGSLLF